MALHSVIIQTDTCNLVVASAPVLIHVLLCLFLFPGEALTEEIELLLPENVIDGSARATLSVLGNQII